MHSASMTQHKRTIAPWDKLRPVDIRNTVFSRMNPATVQLDTSLLEATFLEKLVVKVGRYCTHTHTNASQCSIVLLVCKCMSLCA
jgi:hypothetical protein